MFGRGRGVVRKLQGPIGELSSSAALRTRVQEQPLRRGQERGRRQSLHAIVIFLCTALAVNLFGCDREQAPDLGTPAKSQVDSAPPPGLHLGDEFGDATSDRLRTANQYFNHWVPLLTSGSIDEAKAICESWLDEPDRGHHAEAHKCLANVTISVSRTELSGLPENAQGLVRSPISSEGVEGAIRHYDAAIAATPLDADAHLGRIDVMIVAGRYREANSALDSSLAAFASRALLDNWFKLLGRFQRANAIEAGLDYLKVIERHHPLDHRVISNLGAYYAIAGQYEDALAYSKRAVTINPDDPINKWNLGRVYDQQGQLEAAEQNYLEALALFGATDAKAHCDYAHFLATRIGDADRACSYAETKCGELFESNCVQDQAGEDSATESPASAEKG